MCCSDADADDDGFVVVALVVALVVDNVVDNVVGDDAVDDVVFVATGAVVAGPGGAWVLGGRTVVCDCFATGGNELQSRGGDANAQYGVPLVSRHSATDIARWVRKSCEMYPSKYSPY